MLKHKSLNYRHLLGGITIYMIKQTAIILFYARNHKLVFFLTILHKNVRHGHFQVLLVLEPHLQDHVLASMEKKL